ncbi:Hypothetical protein A7982_01036 [Minicystis rosea]|nr:Hypothetical protein A7982_01036 [Minicystis rosea]
MSTYTSRSRFDESRRFTGVYQQMGRVILDADWNEEVRIRATDAARRSAAVADGAPSDAFSISPQFRFDPVVSLSGWSGLKADPSLLGTVVPELTLARREPASLPYVLRARGYTEVHRALPHVLDLAAAKAPSIAAPPFAVRRLYFELRIDPPIGASTGTPSLVIVGESTEITVPLDDLVANTWKTFVVESTQLVGLDQVKSFKLTGLNPQTTVLVGGLQVQSVNDVTVIHGGDGTMAGAGVMFVDGIRAYLPADITLQGQPDYPMPAMPGGSDGGAEYWALILSGSLGYANWSLADSMTITSAGSSFTVDLHSLNSFSPSEWSQALDTLVSQISAASDGSFVCERYYERMLIRSAGKGPAEHISITGTPSSVMTMMFGTATVTAQGGDGNTAPQPGGIPPHIFGNDITSLVPSQLDGLTLVFTLPSGQSPCTFAGATSLSDVATQIMAAATGISAEIVDNGSGNHLLIRPKPGYGFATRVDLQSSTAAALLGFTSSNSDANAPFGSGDGDSFPFAALVAYLDLWELPVTAREDAFLAEPALDGMETASRMRLVQQVKILGLGADAPIVMPAPTGGGALTTSFGATDARPLRYPSEPFDACRDRCLDTTSIATGTGYRGTENVHVRVQVLATPQGPAALWSRDNGSTLLMLTADAAAGATRLTMSPEDALGLRAGDFVVVEDRITRLQPEGGAIEGNPNNLHRAELRRLRAVDPATGAIELEATGATVGRTGMPLDVGGPLLTSFRVEDQAAVRRWDGADLIEAGYRYNLPDGIDLAFSGAPEEYRAGDFWSFTARVHDPDGQSVGRVEALVEAPPHGPIHRYAPLLHVRIGESDADTVYTDVRRRFLPLQDVRDRLIELERNDAHAAFTIVVGDGSTSFGDIDQDLAHGITGDDAIQTAVNRIGEGGGTIYIRAGEYKLRGPVMISSRSRLRILGDGKATVLEAAGLGGAFFVDQSGADGAVVIQDLHIAESTHTFSNSPDGAAAPPDPHLIADDLLENDATPLDVDQVIASFVAENPPPRAVDVIKAAYARLRWSLRNAHEEAATLSDVLRELPRGAVTISDSSVELRGCVITGMSSALAHTFAVFITGASDAVKIHRCTLAAARGIVAQPLAAYFSDAFVAAHPGAGLSVTDLQIEHNDILSPTATVRGEQGIRLIDGAFDAVAIRDNHVERFIIGVEIGDCAELHGTATGKRVLVADNRVRDCSAVGIQIDADGADVLGNEVACLDALAADNVMDEVGPFQLGIQITGQRVRVRGSWITMGMPGPMPAYGVYAGILVGDGIDDGSSPARPIFDVEISDNRVEGAPADSGAGAAITGVLIGGPQPIYDVRVRGNELRNLGDAGVRVHGTGIAVGRVRIEDNRIEQVCLAEIIRSTTAYQAADRQVLGRLAPGFTIGTSWWNPEAVLEDLDGSFTNAAAAPIIDAALRALERATLRGAIALCRVEDADVRGNTINGVGYTADAGWPTAWTSVENEIRIGGVAVVGGNDVVVESNRIEDVRAPFHGITDPEVAASSPEPTASDALAAITTYANAFLSAQATIHDMAAGLYSQLIELARNATGDGNFQIALCEISAFVERLTADRVMVPSAESLLGIRDRMLSRHSSTGATSGDWVGSLEGDADAARLLVANIAHQTAAPAARAAWSAALRIEEAIARHTGVPAALAEIRANLDLFDGVPTEGETPNEAVEYTLRYEIFNALGASESTEVATGREAIAGFQLLMAFRDETARHAYFATASTPSVSAEFIVALAKDAQTQVTQLGTAPDPDTAVTTLRSKIRALNRVLREAGTDLGDHVTAFFVRIDTPTREGIAEASEDMQNVLQRVIDWASGTATTPDANQLAMAATFVAQVRAGFALAQTAILRIGSMLTRLSNLISSSSVIGTDVIQILFDEIVQLGYMLARDDELNDLCDHAKGRIEDALTPDGETSGARNTALADARASLAKMLTVVRDRFTSMLEEANDGSPTDTISRRLAGLGALLLTLRDTTSHTAPWTSGMPLVATHTLRAMEELGEDSDAIAAASASISAIQTEVLASGTADTVIWRDLETLAHRIDGLAASAARRFRTPQMVATAALLHAAELAINAPSTDNGKGAQCYLDAHRVDVSASIVDQIVAFGDPNRAVKVRRGIRDALLRIAIGEVSEPEEAADIVFPAPEAADGLFAAAVAEQISIGQNTIQSALLGITILGDAGHVLAQPPPATPGELVIEVVGNRLRGCSIGALEIIPRSGPGVVVMVEGNSAVACADLGASQAALGRGLAEGALQIPGSQAVARFAGSGDLLLSGNVFQGNGHGQPSALLHEILVDWRGNVVLRGNTIRHSGGGAGGAAVLILTKVIVPDTAPTTSVLIGKLSLSPALLVEPVAEAVCKPKNAPTPWLPGALTIDNTIVRVSAHASHYIARAGRAPASGVKQFLAWQRTPWRSIRAWFPIERSSVQLEGNHVQSTGPALLIMGASGDGIVTASIVGNELRSSGRSGAVYVRNTDAIVFNGNECESLRSVNVVVMRPDRAPVAITGNVIVGAQPVAQSDRRVSENSYSFAGVPAQNHHTSSLVVVGGTRVVAVGNVTTAGARLLGADQQSELNN